MNGRNGHVFRRQSKRLFQSGTGCENSQPKKFPGRLEKPKALVEVYPVHWGCDSFIANRFAHPCGRNVV